MKNYSCNNRSHGSRAFTLIEMLVVIAIIGALAALLFPVAKNAKLNGYIKRSKAELALLESGIEAYKLKLGFYPPDNPGKPTTNALYFELLGTVENGSNVETKDGSGAVTTSDIKNYFGRENFLNLGSRKATEEGNIAENFIGSQLKQGQFGSLDANKPLVKVFTAPVEWPAALAFQPTPTPNLNPVCYNSSSPTNNTKSYDLWINLPYGGKIYRISNWRKDVETVTPATLP